MYEVVQHEGASHPSSYLLRSETSSEMFQNRKYLRLRSEQPESEAGGSLASEDSTTGKKVRFREDSDNSEQDGRRSFQRRRSPRNHSPSSGGC